MLGKVYDEPEPGPQWWCREVCRPGGPEVRSTRTGWAGRGTRWARCRSAGGPGHLLTDWAAGTDEQRGGAGGGVGGEVGGGVGGEAGGEAGDGAGGGEAVGRR